MRFFNLRSEGISVELFKKAEQELHAYRYPITRVLETNTLLDLRRSSVIRMSGTASSCLNLGPYVDTASFRTTHARPRTRRLLG